MPSLPEHELLSPDEVAAYFKVARKTVYHWIELHELDAIRIGGKLLRITRKSCLKFLGAAECLHDEIDNREG